MYVVVLFQWGTQALQAYDYFWQYGCSTCWELYWASCRLKLQINELFNNQPRTEHTMKDESQGLKTVKKLDSKLQWQDLNTARKNNKDEKSANLRQRSSNVCVRILSHNWLIKITWSYVCGQKLILRQEGWFQSL